VIPAAILALLALAPMALDAVGAGFWTVVLTRGLILGVAAMALQFVLGRGGMVCFGFAAFMGIGAYAVGIPHAEGIEEALVVAPLAMLAGGLYATLTGLVALRTRGVYFIMITLAFGQMAYFAAVALSDYGGDDGLTLWSRPVVAGAAALEGDRAFYFVCLGAAALTWALLRRLGAARFGRALDAARQNEARAEALGFDVFRVRLIAYALSGALGGLSGALLAAHAEFVAPAYMGWHRSGELIVMVVLGGVGNLPGAALGALALAAVEEWLSHLTLHWRLILGVLIVLMALFARRGLAGLLERRP
jgi:branched-chain amino acid transport system permease protein